MNAYQRPISRIAAVALIFAAGCDVRKTGFFVKGGQAVYATRGGDPGSHVMTRDVPADADTFVAIPPILNAPKHALEYARDSQKVFLGALTRPYELKGCDPATFSILTPDGKYTRDASHVYYCGIQLAHADPATFKVLQPPYARDSQHAYAGAVLMEVLDITTFEVVIAGDSGFPLTTGHPTLVERDTTNPRTSIWGWAKDSQAYYYADARVTGADRESFEVLNNLHAKDKAYVYYARERKATRIPGADPATFELLGPGMNRGRDKDHEFVQGKPVVKAGQVRGPR